MSDPSLADPPFAVPPDDAPFGFDSLGRRKRRPPEFSLDQMERIREFYTVTPPLEFDLFKLAAELGKSRQNIARFARKAGWTARNRPSNARQVANARKPRWGDRPHPRGMAGKQHGEPAKAKMSVASKVRWSTQRTFGGPLFSEQATMRRREIMRLRMASQSAEKSYTNRKGGRRDDLGGQFFRSSWEANYARYLNFLMKLGVVEAWAYEPTVFWFEGIKRGVTNYRPDFRVKYKGDPKEVYEEIKGWIVPKDRTKWARMRKYHPGVKLVIIYPKDYYAIQKKWASAITTWERGRAPSPRVTIRPMA